MQSTIEEQPQTLPQHREKETTYSLKLAIAIRAALTVWLAAAWALVDPFFPSTAEWQSHGFYTLPAQPTLIGRMLVDVWLRWDAVHFMNIAQKGYAALHDTSFAFFPGFPLLARAVAALSFQAPPSVPALVVASLLISTIAVFFSIIGFRALVLTVFGDPDLAKWSTLLWLFFPTAFFLFAPYSDALFSAFAIGALLMLEKKRWLLSGILAALAGITRSQGILLVLPIGLSIALYMMKERRHPTIAQILALVIAPAGWLAFNRWSQAQAALGLLDMYSLGWKNKLADPFTVFLHTVAYVIHGGRAVTFFEILAVLVFGITLLWMLTQKKFRASLPLLLYSVATMGSLMVWDCNGCSGYISFLRYALSLYPVFIGFASLAQRIPLKARRLLVTASGLLMMICAALYSLWVFVG